MIKEARIPKRSSIMCNRKTGDLSDRKVPGNQSQAQGGRYDTQAMTEADRKIAMEKAKNLKNKTETGQASDLVVLNPDKNILAQGLN